VVLESSGVFRAYSSVTIFYASANSLGATVSQQSGSIVMVVLGCVVVLVILGYINILVKIIFERNQD
jgi:hypothetical protein